MFSHPLAPVALALVLFSATACATQGSPLLSLALPSGGQPEGITAGPGPLLYASRLGLGGVVAVDVYSGAIATVVADRPGRAAVGLEYWNGLLLVAGGGPRFGATVLTEARLHVYNATTGEEHVTCRVPPETGFANDVVVFGDKAFVTSTFGSDVVSFTLEGIVGKECVVETVDLSGVGFGAEAGSKLMNGIAASALFKGLFVADFSDKGAIWFVDGTTGAASRVIADGETPGADGVVVDGDIMYVVENTQSVVSIWKLAYDNVGLVKGERLRVVNETSFDRPATGAIKDGVLYAVNTRFSDFPPFGTADLSGVDFSVIGFPAEPVAPLPERTPILGSIPLLAGGQPEGCANGAGPIIYASRLTLGGVVSVDVLSGKVEQVVPDAPDRNAAGLWYSNELIFVAGGGPGFGGPLNNSLLHVYDAATGEDHITCEIQPAAGFANDVVVYGDKVFVTNTFGSDIVSLTLDGVVNKTCTSELIDMSSAGFGPASDRRMNGIVGAGHFNGLFVADFGKGAVFFVDGSNGVPVQIIADGDAKSADGLMFDEGEQTLYIVQNSVQAVSVYKVSQNTQGDLSATLMSVKEGETDGISFEQPTTGAIKNGVVYIVNSRFAAFPPFRGDPSGAEFNMTAFRA